MTATTMTPSLYGLTKTNSNKDFSNPDSWGKNQFNNAFPVSLCCYAHTEKVDPVYLELDSSMKVKKDKISVENVFGLPPLSKDLFFAFESAFTPCTTMVVNSLARIDLVTLNTSNMQNKCLRPLEIKLTALPDNTTADVPEEKYGSEIVVRPDSILYLALSISRVFSNTRNELKKHLEPIYTKSGINWREFSEVKPLIKDMVSALDKILMLQMQNQSPFMLQPIWKTEGKTLHLCDNCFDVFVWSDFAFTRLFIDNINEGIEKINRRMRTVVWLTRMLYDFAINGKIDYRQICDSHTYDTRNDKAFAISGTLTNPYMACEELTNPRIPRTAIKNIILGGGEKYLSPERRLDAAILANPELFK
jgi:hypothetical protein